MMLACTSFGHKECYQNLTELLYQTIENLILHEQVDTFYVGNQGRFDAQVHSVLTKIEEKYPIRYAVVLAYMPGKKIEYEETDTMLPEGIEKVHPRYAIEWRNKWMLDHSDYVIAFVTHTWGGAAKFTQKAERMHKTVIYLR